MKLGNQEFKQNVAIMFMKYNKNIEVVKAWDGYAVYIGNKFEFSTTDKEFQRWSLTKNKYVRDAGQLITYYRDSQGGINFQPRVKYRVVAGIREYISVMEEIK